MTTNASARTSRCVAGRSELPLGDSTCIVLPAQGIFGDGAYADGSLQQAAAVLHMGFASDQLVCAEDAADGGEVREAGELNVCRPSLPHLPTFQMCRGSRTRTTSRKQPD